MSELNEHEESEREDLEKREEISPKPVSRRQFLKMVGATGAAVGLAGGLGGLVAACGEEKPTTTTAGPVTTAGSATTAAPSTTTVTAAPGPAEKLKVGFPVALSGFFSVQDVVCADEMKILTEMINEQGIMIKDKRYEIELLEEDIKSTFDGVSAAVNSLVYDKGVKFMIGPSAFFNPAASPITNQDRKSVV